MHWEEKQNDIDGTVFKKWIGKKIEKIGVTYFM